MELGTFGAIFKFAIEFEQACARYYREAAAGESAALSLAASAEKRVARLDRVRREMVTEMILEPITGLRPQDYEVDWAAKGSGAARTIEEAARRFYTDMAARISVAEVARAFKKLAQEHENNLKT